MPFNNIFGKNENKDNINRDDNENISNEDIINGFEFNEEDDEETIVQESKLPQSFSNNPHHIVGDENVFNSLISSMEDDEEAQFLRAKENDTLNHFHNDDDNVKKTIDENIRQIRSNDIGGGIKNIRYITTDLLMEAPADYFDKYEDDIQRGATYVRDKLTETGQSEVLNNAKLRPTDEEVQNNAYYVVNSLVSEYTNSKSLWRDTDRKIITAMICNEILGFGRLEPLWRDPKIDEILCNGPFDIQVEIKGEIHKVPACKFKDQDHLMALIRRLYEAINKTVSRNNPIVDGRLHDNSRMAVVHPAVAPAGPNFSIRKHKEEYISPQQLIDWNTADKEVMTHLGNLIYKGCSVLVLGGTSSGKALTLDTPIATINGWKTMGQIEIGDTVYDRKGQPTHVTNKFLQNPNKVYDIEFENGETISCDANHNWYVKKDGNNDLAVKTTGELLTNFSEYSIPVLSEAIEYKYDFEKGQSLSPTELPAHPYLFGLWLTKSLFEVFKNQDNEINEVIKKLDKKSITKTIKLLPVNNPHHDKEIPEILEFSSKISRTLLINGIIDGIGEATSNGWSITTHPKLITSINKIVTSLGYKTIIEDDNLLILTDDALALSPIKSEDAVNININNNIHEQRIVNIIETHNVEPMACITVDAEDSTYLAGYSHVVTHNTTLLGALAGFFRPHDRILTLEDNLELKLPKSKFLAPAMECIDPKPDVAGSGVTMRDLVKASLRLTPDAIVVGEVRDGSAYDLCQALNTGHYGMSTVHANSEIDGIYRLVSLVSEGGTMQGNSAFQLIASSFDVIVHIDKLPVDGSRKIVSISEVASKPAKNEQSGEVYLPTKRLWKFINDGKDENNKVLGHWEKCGEISTTRREMRRLDVEPDLTWEQLRELSQS